ncbi:MAG: PAS domain-containing protein [Bacteriovoracales bacterium]
MGNLLKLLESLGESFPNSFVISDLNQEDQPLVYVNDNFVKLTGYERLKILGRNCRFLQGPLSDRETVKNIRLALRNRKSCFFDLLNHKYDGTPFWNRLVLIPFGYSEDELDYCIGIQQNVSDKYGVEKYFLENVTEKEIAKEVKNPFLEVFNANRSLKYLGSEQDEEYQKIKTQISNSISQLNYFIKSK